MAKKKLLSILVLLFLSSVVFGRQVSFSGYNWTVKRGWHGPGENYFSDSVENVWVDEDGYLHMKIAYRSFIWYCSEVINNTSLGYGTYVYTVKGRADWLDKNIVLGLFTWDTAHPYEEIDVEISKWGGAGNNCQFVVQPWYVPGNIVRFYISHSTGNDVTTHIFNWSASSIKFVSYYGPFSIEPAWADVIKPWNYIGSDNPVPATETPRINFWLFDTDGDWRGNPPSNGLDSEFVIKKYHHFSNVPNIAGDVDFDNDVDGYDYAFFASRWLETECNALNNFCGWADCDLDGQVDAGDLMLLGSNWLRGTTP